MEIPHPPDAEATASSTGRLKPCQEHTAASGGSTDGCLASRASLVTVLPERKVMSDLPRKSSHKKSTTTKRKGGKMRRPIIPSLGHRLETDNFYVTPVRGVIHIGEYDEHNRFDVQLTVPADELHVRTNQAGQMYFVIFGVADMSNLFHNYRELIDALDAIMQLHVDDIPVIDREELEDALEVFNEQRCEIEYAEQIAQEYAEHFGTKTPEEEYQNKLAWEGARIRDLLTWNLVHRS